MATKRRCPECGFAFVAERTAERLAHGRYHRAYRDGPLIGGAGWRLRPSFAGEPDLILVCAQATDAGLFHKRIARVAELAARAAGFDRPPWQGTAETDEARAYLALAGRRAVGLAIFRRRHVHRRATLEGPAWTPAGGGSLRWSLDLAWTAPAWQGRGLARRLLAAAAADLGVAVKEIALLKPFTPAGARLARHLAGGAEFWLG